MNRGRHAVLAAILLTCSAAWAEDAASALPEGMGRVTGKVRLRAQSLLGTETVQATDAVVFRDGVLPVKRKTRKGPPQQMTQRNKAFEPGLLVIQKGDLVTFPNDDKVFHNVFSLTEGSKFDLGVYAQGTSKTVRFSKAGAVDVFCNIHPQMIGSIVVLENPFYARISADGAFTLDLPPGRHKLVAFWVRGARQETVVDVKAGQTVSLDFDLLDSGQKLRHTDKDGQAYGRYK